MRPIDDNPCKDCVPPKRSPGCHSSCVDYMIAKAFHEAKRDEQYQESQVRQYSIDIARRNGDICRKRKRDFKGHYWRNT